MRTIKALSLMIFMCFLQYTSSSFAQEQSDIINYDNLLLVEVNIERIQTGETIEIYQHDGGFIVPLGLMAQILDFPIDVDVDNQTARGWFIEEGRIFDLNVSRNEVIVNGKKSDLDSRPLFVNYDDIYVDSSFFSSWFNIDLELIFSDLFLVVRPREKLPIQAQLDRNQLRARLLNYKSDKKTYDTIENPYKSIDYPFLDFGLGYDYSNDSETFNRVSYSAVAQGDIGYLTGNIVMTGENSSNQEEDSLTGLRASLGREDYEGKLLGKLQATSFKFGDINSVPVSLATENGRGRGFAVSSAKLERSDQFDSTNFTGDTQPGWEVELYRNGTLLDFQVVGDDGRYEFLDIPIFFGNNIFRVVSYGPQGQTREETKRYRIDDSILQKGEFNYSLSIDEKNLSVFGVDEGRTVNKDKEGVRVVGNVEYGLTNRMSASVGYARTPIREEFHEYNTFSLRNSFQGALTELNYVYDTSDGGWASQLALNTEIKGVQIRGEQNFYDDFTSEVESSTSQKISQTKIDLNGNFNYLSRINFAYSLGFDYEQFESNRENITLKNRLSTSLYGVNLTNSLQFRETRTATDSTNLVTGDFSVRGRYRDMSLRLSTDYEIDPIVQLRSANLVGQKKLDKSTNLRVGIRKDLIERQLTSVNSSVNKEFKHFTWSLVLQGDSENNISAGTRLAFSLGREPREDKWYVQPRSMSQSGAVSALAFLDANYNNIFDEGEEVIPQAIFTSRGNTIETEDTEPAFITRLAENAPVNVEIDLASLDDPFWMPKSQGYTVNPRPGSVVKVDFPVIVTTEIDGMVYLNRGDKSRPVSRVELNLIDNKGNIAYTTKSEFDGFYIFSGVVPGEYILKISDDSMERFKAKEATLHKMSITKDSDILSNIDMTIYGASKEDKGQKASEDDLTYDEKICYEPGCYAPGVPSIIIDSD